MNNKRPVNLDLVTMKFPVMAIVSILHRLSGMILFLLLPLMLYFLSMSLHSVETFSRLHGLLLNPVNKFLVWVFGSALIYHLIAGIRHMVMDLGFGESLNAGRHSASLIIVLSIIFTIFLGIWLW